MSIKINPQKIKPVSTMNPEEIAQFEKWKLLNEHTLCTCEDQVVKQNKKYFIIKASTAPEQCLSCLKENPQ